MTTLHATINELASNFAHDLLRALRGASLEQIVAETAVGHARRRLARPTAQTSARPKKIGKRVRRSASDLAKTVDKIVVALKGHKNGMRSEQLQKVLHLPKKAITGPIALALKSRKITKRGQRRATTYLAT